MTCALIGTQTWERRWVRYEILKSYDRGNKLFGIHINSVKDKNQNTFAQGRNIFDYLGFVISKDGKKLTYYEHDGNNWKAFKDLDPKQTNFSSEYWGKGYKLSNLVKVYDWSLEDGYINFPSWLENAK